MKKIIIALVSLLLLVVLIGACATPAPAPAPAPKPAASPSPAPSPAPSPSPSPTQKPAAGWPASISFADTFPGTGGHATIVGISEVITKYVGIKTVTEPGATGNKNIMILKNKDAELAQIFADQTYDAARGLGEYKQYGKIDLRLLWMASLPTPFTFLTLANTGVTTLTDLKGKKVMMIFSGNSTFTKTADLLLESVGMTRNDLVAMPFSNQGEAIPALKESRISAFIQPHAARGLASWLQEMNLTSSSPVLLFTAPENKLNDIIAKYPYLAKYALDGKTYGKMIGDKNLPTVAIPEGIFSRSDVPDDLIYAIMKAVFSHVEEINQYHAQATQYTANPLAFKPQVPFQAGAVRFYRERGLWTDQLEATQKQILAEVGASK